MGSYRRNHTEPTHQDIWASAEQVVTGQHNGFSTKRPAASLRRLRLTDTAHQSWMEHRYLEPRTSARLVLVAFDAMLPEMPAPSRSMLFCAPGIWRLLRHSSRPLPVSVALSVATSGRATESISAGSLPPGLDTSESTAMACFDEARVYRCTANVEWHTSDDPDARVGRSWSGPVDMILHARTHRRSGERRGHPGRDWHAVCDPDPSCERRRMETLKERLHHMFGSFVANCTDLRAADAVYLLLGTNLFTK